MDALLAWTALVVPSALWGVLCALRFRSKFTGIAAAAVPWFVLLLFILFSEYYLPYQGGGASMWPIAQLFGGTVAATVAYQAYKVSMRFLGKRT